MWWKSVKTPYDTIIDDTTWVSFRTLLRTKYIPAHIQAQKIIEFESLKQGENTVQEYEQQQVTNLSRFALSLAALKDDKLMRFIRGMRPDI